MRDISHCGTSRINQKSAQTKTRCECRTFPSLPNTSPNALIEVGDTVDIPNDQKCVGRAPWKGNLNSTSHCREGKDISTCHWHTERTSATRHGKEIRIRPAIVGEKNISACHRHTERTALWKGCLLERACFASSEPLLCLRGRLVVLIFQGATWFFISLQVFAIRASIYTHMKADQRKCVRKPGQLCAEKHRRHRSCPFHVLSRLSFFFAEWTRARHHKFSSLAPEPHAQKKKKKGAPETNIRGARTTEGRQWKRKQTHSFMPSRIIDGALRSTPAIYCMKRWPFFGREK